MAQTVATPGHVERGTSRTFRAVLLALLFALGNVPFADAARIVAVASDGNEATSLIGRDPVRSAYYLVFADTGELLEVLDNPYRSGPKGAEKGVTDFLARHKVGVAVAEGFSPAVAEAMMARGIKPLAAKGIARQAVRRFVPDAAR